MKLNQVTLPVSDVPRAIDFYSLLGLKLIVEALPRYARFEIPGDEATLSLHKADVLPTGEGIALYFESDRLDAWVAELKSKGVVFDEDPEDRRWLWREARLHDPDGNRLILYYAGNNRTNPPWRLADS